MLPGVILVVFICVIFFVSNSKYRLERKVLEYLELQRLWDPKEPDFQVLVKSRQAVDNYKYENYFKEDHKNISRSLDCIHQKKLYRDKLKQFLSYNEFQNKLGYRYVEDKIMCSLPSEDPNVLISVLYMSPAGRSTYEKTIHISEERIRFVEQHPELLMSTTEYNRWIKNCMTENLERKKKNFYDVVNDIIDAVNNNKTSIIRKTDIIKLDELINSLLEKIVNKVDKIKKLDSQDWSVLEKVVSDIKNEVFSIISANQKVLDYYESNDFSLVKNSCRELIQSQMEFNQYIEEKAKSITKLFGRRITRNETVFDDKYSYVHPYNKSITPFSVEVSSQVFSSAENNPLQYIVKYFYPDKSKYNEQIQQLQTLISELQTLHEARDIINIYKKDYEKYISNVPKFVLDYDEDEFYKRLGFADISEKSLTVEYKFSYTSNSGLAQRSFTVPMSEETIIQIISILENKLTHTEFAKEQRRLMTSKLRQIIKERDNYTCKYCKNSTYKEPNLLLEIDHIVPVAKGGYTTEDNLQTLCWRCNRNKSDKLIENI